MQRELLAQLRDWAHLIKVPRGALFPAHQDLLQPSTMQIHLQHNRDVQLHCSSILLVCLPKATTLKGMMTEGRACASDN